MAKRPDLQHLRPIVLRLLLFQETRTGKQAGAEARPNGVVWRWSGGNKFGNRHRLPCFEQKGKLIPVFICRWPNGDVSLAAGESEVEVADVLDEVDNPDAAELMQLDHSVAVHFKLGARPGEDGTLPLRFENLSEQLESSIYERAYPVYNETREESHLQKSAGAVFQPLGCRPSR
jgi:hypothetical protein